MSGFRKCGIHPFNRNAIPTLSSGNDSDASDTEITPEDNSDPSSTITDPCDGAQNTNNTTTPAPTPPCPKFNCPILVMRKLRSLREDTKRVMMSTWMNSPLHG